MQKIITVIFLFFISGISFSQTTEAHYYKDQYLTKETTESKAEYIRTITTFPDGTKTIEVKYIAANEVIQRESMKESEPVGNWIMTYGNKRTELNYDFDLIYSDEACHEDIILTDYFTDDAGLLYKAPVIGNDQTMFKYIGNNIFYPRIARDNGIEGKVYVIFTITAEGNVTDIHVARGVAIMLDKEAVRVLREITFTSPPMLQGKPVDVCLTLPISFQLE